MVRARLLSHDCTWGVPPRVVGEPYSKPSTALCDCLWFPDACIPGLFARSGSSRMRSHTFCRSCRLQLRRAVATHNEQTTTNRRNTLRNTRHVSTSERPTHTVARRGWKDAVVAPISAYGRLQKRRPYVTQVSTMATVFFTGDLSAQCVSSQLFSTLHPRSVPGEN